MTHQSIEPGSAADARACRVALVRTEHAARYLGQLCKHFAHKLPVEFDEQQGWISFSIGDCRLAARHEDLWICVEGTPDKIEQLEDVVARHLIRFAFREVLTFKWTVPRAEAVAQTRT